MDSAATDPPFPPFAGELPRCAAVAEDFAASVIGGFFSLVFPSADLRKRLGIVAVSPRPDSPAGWYVWLAGDAGAYELALLPQQFEAGADLAHLALRYFPVPDSDRFDAFSPLEQSTRQSPLFDTTGTPRFDRIDELHAAQFHIATLTLAAEGEIGVGLTLQTQDVWRAIENTATGILVHRRVPGLELAAPVLQALVRGMAFLGRLPPSAVRLTTQPGIVGRLEAGDAFLDPAPDVTQYTVSVHGLVRPGKVANAPLPVPPADEEPSYEHLGTAPPVDPPPPIEAVWWAAPRWRFMPVGAFCATCLKDDDALVTGRDSTRAPPDLEAMSLDDLSESAL